MVLTWYVFHKTSDKKKMRASISTDNYVLQKLTDDISSANLPRWVMWQIRHQYRLR